jgi:hypothetical protein
MGTLCWGDDAADWAEVARVDSGAVLLVVADDDWLVTVEVTTAPLEAAVVVEVLVVVETVVELVVAP